jgi:hypothetical protein
MPTIADITNQPVITADDLHAVKRMKAEAERALIVEHYTNKIRENIIKTVRLTYSDCVFTRFNDDVRDTVNTDPRFRYNQFKSDPTHEIVQEILDTLRAMFPDVTIRFDNRHSEQGIYASWVGKSVEPQKDF